jgi:hypothetical protein
MRLRDQQTGKCIWFRFISNDISKKEENYRVANEMLLFLLCFIFMAMREGRKGVRGICWELITVSDIMPGLSSQSLIKTMIERMQRREIKQDTFSVTLSWEIVTKSSDFRRKIQTQTKWNEIRVFCIDKRYTRFFLFFCVKWAFKLLSNELAQSLNQTSWNRSSPSQHFKKNELLKGRDWILLSSFGKYVDL